MYLGPHEHRNSHEASPGCHNILCIIDRSPARLESRSLIAPRYEASTRPQRNQLHEAFYEVETDYSVGVLIMKYKASPSSSTETTPMSPIRAALFYSPMLPLLILVIGLGGVIYSQSRTFSLKARTTKLLGPLASSWLFGVLRELDREESGILYERWAERFGPAYQIPGAFGCPRVVLFDPRAISHFFSKDTYGYVHQANRKKLIEQLVIPDLFFEVNCLADESYRQEEAYSGRKAIYIEGLLRYYL